MWMSRGSVSKSVARRHRTVEGIGSTTDDSSTSGLGDPSVRRKLDQSLGGCWVQIRKGPRSVDFKIGAGSVLLATRRRVHRCQDGLMDAAPAVIASTHKTDSTTPVIPQVEGCVILVAVISRAASPCPGQVCVRR